MKIDVAYEMVRFRGLNIEQEAAAHRGVNDYGNGYSDVPLQVKERLWRIDIAGRS
jgi:hypothetical protein